MSCDLFRGNRRLDSGSSVQPPDALDRRRARENRKHVGRNSDPHGSIACNQSSRRPRQPGGRGACSQDQGNSRDGHRNRRSRRRPSSRRCVSGHGTSISAIEVSCSTTSFPRRRADLKWSAGSSQLTPPPVSAADNWPVVVDGPSWARRLAACAAVCDENGRGGAPHTREERAIVAQPVVRARNNRVSSGTISWRSPTTPPSQKPKIGASGSELIATINADRSIPTRCWRAPEIPHAM